MVEEIAQPWYKYPINIPYGNKNYDVQLGGSHDLCVETPLSTPITLLRAGIVTDVSTPSWGHQVCLKLDNPVTGEDGRQVHYMAYIHLGTVAHDVKVGTHLDGGHLIGYSGGANRGSFDTPLGPGFINSEFMSSGPQTGVALMNGPIYGTGAGWDPLDKLLDPTEVVKAGPVLPAPVTEETNETPSMEEAEEQALEKEVNALKATIAEQQTTITTLKAGPEQAHINAVITAIDALKAALEKLVR